MEKILIYGLLLGSINNLNSMEDQPGSSKEDGIKILELPNEIRSLFIERVIKTEINGWTDIFNFDNESLKKQIKRICRVSKNFNVLSKEELINCVKRLKELRFFELKQIIKEQHKGFSKEKLNENVAYLLDIWLHNESVELRTKETLEEAVRFIIAGADVDIENTDGKTALIWAARIGHTKIVKLLIDAGGDVRTKDHHGLTALMAASFRGSIEIVKLLIKIGGGVNIKDNDDSTALIWAIRGDHIEIVKLLIDAGADVNIQDNYGETALTFAKDLGNTEIVELISSKSE